MKDLYEWLSISPDTSKGIIRRRLQRIDDEELTQEVQEVLLHSGRREVYDRNYRLLKTIGELRARLKLNDGANWRKGKASRDFSVDSKKGGTQEQFWEDRNATRQSSTAPGKSQRAVSSTGVTPTRLLKRVGQFLLTIAARRPVLVLIGIIGIVVWASNGSSGLDSSEPSSVETVNVPPNQGADSGEETGKQATEETYPHDPVPLPENGTWWNYTSERRIAPLRISVSSEEHYFIKVVDAYTEERVLTLFIRSGQTANVEVPTGTYRLKYAVGDTWYGQEHKFGPEKRYFEAENTFTFEIVGQRVRGHRIELILQQGGNLSTKSIPQKEF
jgi:hypothetical protein